MMQDEAGSRREMVRIGRLLYERQLIVAAEGNLSVRLGGDRFLVTPASRCKGFLEEADLLVVDGAGSPASAAGGEGRPSSEWLLHREIYAVRDDAQAVCHGHPPWATALAAARRPLTGCLLPEVIGTLGGVPLAPYATPGTAEVPRSVRPLLPGHDAILLANHGVVALGATLEEAFFRLETVERLAQVTLLAGLAGGGQRLDSAEVGALLGASPGRAGGDRGARLPCLAADAPGEQLGVGRDLESLAAAIARGILAELGR